MFINHVIFKLYKIEFFKNKSRMLKIDNNIIDMRLFKINNYFNN